MPPRLTTLEEYVHRYATHLKMCVPGTRLFFEEEDPYRYWQFPGVVNGREGDYCTLGDGYIEPSNYTLEEMIQNDYATEVIAWDPDLLVDEGL